MSFTKSPSSSRLGSRPQPRLSTRPASAVEPLTWLDNDLDFFSSVSSPDQFSYGSLQEPPCTTSTEPLTFNFPNSPSRQRPGFARRQSMSNRTSGFMRAIPGGHTPREHQWSPFGQLRSPGGPNYGEGRMRSQANMVSQTDIDPFSQDTNLTLSPPRPQNLEDQADEEPYIRDTDYESDVFNASTTVSQDSVPAATNSKWYSLETLPTISTLHRNILKCAIAYFIGSLFTFNPYLSSFLSGITSGGQGDRKMSIPIGHMVATVTVYYNPAKTMGGMLEADLFCLVGLLYASFVSLCSISMYWFFDAKPGWEIFANVLVIVWIGVCMSALVWTKVWTANPSFDNTCSMTAIILFVVIVREGGVGVLLQVISTVIVGALVSNVICYALWPQSASRNLQDSMSKTLDSFSTILTETFLLEEPLRPLSDEKVQRAVQNHQSSFTLLKKNLAEHSKWFKVGLSGRSSRSLGKAFEDAVGSMTRLAQHLNGLRSSTTLQYELTKTHGEGNGALKKNRTSVAKIRETSGPNGENLSTSVSSVFDPAGNRRAKKAPEDEEERILNDAAAMMMFGDLVDDLGPSLKVLSTTCASSLKTLREAFVRHRKQDKNVAIHSAKFVQLVERALFTSESTSNQAMMRLYRNREMSRSDRGPVHSPMGDNTLLTTGDNEHVFLVYFFIFTLQEFAQELVALIDSLGCIYAIEQERKENAGMFGYFARAKKTLFRKIEQGTEPIPSYLIPQRYRQQPSFPQVKPRAPNILQAPVPKTFIGRVKQWLWAVRNRIKQRDIKYATKAGMATALLAAPAFFRTTKPIFMEFRGEWALISFYVVISPTIGATNFLGLHRILGTLFGAGTAALLFTTFPDTPVILSIFGFFYSIPCFYYNIAKPQYGATSRFVLLTYNITCLFCYNACDKDISAVNVAYRRSAAVTVGVVWAVIVSRTWWPVEARRELSEALGEFCLNVGWLYTKLVASNSFVPEIVSRTPTENTPLLSIPARAKLNNSIQEFTAMELHLQIKLIELQELLAQTQNEPRLKGPFPVDLYRSVLTSLQTILDKIHNKHCVTTGEEWFTSVRRGFMLPVDKEHHEMSGNIILSFSTLASAFRLKVPPYLPPADKSRQRLVDAIRQLDVVEDRGVKGSRQLLFFAYALTMKGVTAEIEHLGKMLQTAFGVIGQTPEVFFTSR